MCMGLWHQQGCYTAGITSLTPVTVKNVFIDFTAQMAVPAPQHTHAACFHGKSNYIVSLRTKATTTENKTLMSQFPYFTLKQIFVLCEKLRLTADSKSALAEFEFFIEEYFISIFCKWSKDQLMSIFCLCFLMVTIQVSCQCPWGPAWEWLVCAWFQLLVLEAQAILIGVTAG